MADEEPLRSQGAWIFVSHSHQDLEKVRQVRDELEKRGHNPLLFFLKSLSDDDEINGLIEREIHARTWFVLCDSENARGSNWVQRELAIIKELPGKVYKEVDLDRDLEKQVAALAELSRRATAFLSYARPDQEMARQLATALRAHDFGVFLDIEDLAPGDDWAKATRGGLAKALDHGYVLALLQPESLRSEFMQSELRFALEHPRAGSALVPIAVADRDAVLEAAQTRLPELVRFQFWDLAVPADAEPQLLAGRIEELIGFLKTRELA